MADWRTDDRELLARILTAEAGNQGPLGMTAAGNVIMNRAGRTGYGEGVRGVIMKPGQFSPMNSVTGYASGEQGQNIDSLRPSDTAYMVTDSLLQGTAGDITDGATHFYNPKISNPSWAKGKEFKQIGDHVFGKADAGRGTTQNTGPMTGSNQPQRTGAPMGLLDTQPNQQPEQQKSGFWNNFAGGLLADPDRRAKIGIALEGMTLNPNQGLIQNLQSGINDRKEQAVANRTIEWLAKQPGGQKFAELAASAGPAAALRAYQESVSGANGPAGFQALKAQALAAGLVEGTPEFQQFMLYGGAKQDATPSAFQALHLQAIAAGYAEGTPEYQRFMQTRGAGEVASARALGTAQGAASSELAGGEIAMNQALNLVEALKNDPALPSMVGPIDSYKPNVSAAANRFQSRLDQLKGTAFLQAYQMLKGGGAITENEGKKAEQAMSRLNTAMNEEDFIAALNEFQDAVRTGYEKIQARSGMGAQPMAPSAGIQPTQGNDDPLGLRGTP